MSKLVSFRSAFCILYSAFLICLLLNTGCETVGAVGGLLARNIPRHIDAAYKGLAGQTVIVMVYIDRGLKMDHPGLQLDVASSLQTKLINTAKDDKPDTLKGAVFPVRASTVIRNEEDHPEWTPEDITDVATKFDGTRLIFVELQDFSTHSGAEELYRGSLSGSLKVIEMKDGKAIVAYTENNIDVTYPKDSPKDGLPIGTDNTITQGTVDTFTTELGKRFYPHDEDRD
jgi:hypothetical protein